jgi:formate hydrogenlyase subunit 6/NADH:ubiquinone oxidoreductase subunit I
MLDFLRTRWAQGTRTSPFPAEVPDFPERFRGRPVLDRSRCLAHCLECLDETPSSLLQVGADGRATLDTGACLFSPEEASGCRHCAVAYTSDHRLAARSRGDLATSNGDLPAIQALEESSRRLQWL